MEEMGKTTDLVRRKNGIYYCRRRCPKHLLRKGIPVEKSLSLQTNHRALAVERLNEARAQIDAVFRGETLLEGKVSAIAPAFPRLRRPDHPELPILTRDEVEPLARRFFAKAWDELELRTAELVGLEPNQKDMQRVELEQRQSLLEHPSETDLEHPALAVEIKLLREAGRRSPFGSQPSLLLRSYVHRAMRQLCFIEMARLRGDFRDTITDNFFQASVSGTNGDPTAAAAPTSVTTPSAVLTFEALVSSWSHERGVAQKTLDAHRAVARWFVERVGIADVATITTRDVLSFKDKLVEEGTTPANIKTKLNRLHTMLQYAVENAHLADNPAKNIKVRDRDAARRKRREFDLASLDALFSSPVYVEDERPKRGRGEAAYWIPLIALYSGARLEEIAQLRPSDVRKERYIDGGDQEAFAWVIAISNDEEDGLETKNANSERRVPVHPDLIRLGLVKYATDAAARKQRQLFPALTPNLYGKVGAKWGEWWSIYRREVCGIMDRRIVFHSFRHTFKYYARHVGMVEGVQRQVMGHSPGDTADEYGPSRYSLYQLVEGMKKYRIPGLRLPPPPPPYR